MRALSTKQQAFVDSYTGNATQAARVAGYKHVEASGKDLMRTPKVIAAITTRDHGKRCHMIATREERQIFWTSIMRDEKRPMSHRLRAAELLGKSEADFVDRTKFETCLEEELQAMSDEEIRSRIKIIEDSGVLVQ